MKGEPDVEARLRQMQLVSPRADLRAQTLSRASTEATPALSWSDRLWSARPLRWAWAALVVVLLLSSYASDRAVTARLEGGPVDRPALPPAEDLCAEEPAVCDLQARFRNGPLDDGSSARRQILEENL